jgi:hypothetical protein
MRREHRRLLPVLRSSVCIVFPCSVFVSFYVSFPHSSRSWSRNLARESEGREWVQGAVVSASTLRARFPPTVLSAFFCWHEVGNPSANNRNTGNDTVHHWRQPKVAYTLDLSPVPLVSNIVPEDSNDPIAQGPFEVKIKLKSTRTE